jgi:hypothetical protein
MYPHALINSRKVTPRFLADAALPPPMPAGADPERFQFLQTYCQRMPTESECPALYDFLMGKAPPPTDFHKIGEWLRKDNLRGKHPAEWPTIGETRMKVMKLGAGMQGFCPEFVPTFQLNNYHRATQGEIYMVAAASESGLVCNVEDDVRSNREQARCNRHR